MSCSSSRLLTLSQNAPEGDRQGLILVKDRKWFIRSSTDVCGRDTSVITKITGVSLRGSFQGGERIHN